MEIVKNLQLAPAQTFQPTLFIFEFSREAALHNAIVLENYNFDLSKAVLDQQDSQVSFGSEFRKPEELKELLLHHPYWKHLKTILLYGATFPLNQISPEDRRQDLLFHHERGNHKSASKYRPILDKLIMEDIRRVFALPLPTQLIHVIPNASLAHLSCHLKETINEKGKKILKHRMMHNQSFPGPSGQSVNNRVIHDLLPHCMYSCVLLRSLHYIISV
jgi:hypothetical protein